MYLNILQSIFVSWISPSFKKMALKLLIVFSFQLKVIPGARLASNITVNSQCFPNSL